MTIKFYLNQRDFAYIYVSITTLVRFCPHIQVSKELEITVRGIAAKHKKNFILVLPNFFRFNVGKSCVI